MFTDVYERLVVPGQKPGFWQLLATQVTSAVWHVRTCRVIAVFIRLDFMDCDALVSNLGSL